MMNKGLESVDWKLLMSMLGGRGPRNFSGADITSQQGMGYAPGAESSIAETATQDPNAELMKMLKQYLMQGKGNQFYSPFQKGPDIWGGLQGAVQDYMPQGFLGKLLGLGK